MNIQEKESAPVNPDGGSWMQTTRQIATLVTPPLLVFIAYMQLAEDRRARQRWEEPDFTRRVEQIIKTDLDARRLATREDVQRVADQVSDLSEQVRPIVTYMIQRGVIE